MFDNESQHLLRLEEMRESEMCNFMSVMFDRSILEILIFIESVSELKTLRFHCKPEEKKSRKKVYAEKFGS